MQKGEEMNNNVTTHAPFCYRARMLH